MSILIDRLYGADTVGSTLDKRNGITNSFDILRLYLAFMVLYSHLGLIIGQGSSTGGEKPIEDTATHVGLAVLNIRFTDIFHAFSVLSVPMFFALSGFLVAASSERNRNVLVFLSFRGLRIFPALVIEVTLSALVLGPIFTTLNLREYFSNSAFFEYFLNIIGVVRFYLPGVFENHPEPGIVNINLWTLPAEFYCYLILSALMLTGVLWKKYVILSLCVISMLAWISAVFIFDHNIRPLNFTSSFIVFFFMIGVLFYSWRYYIKINIFIILLALCGSFGFMSLKGLEVFSVPFIVYLAVAAGCITLPIPKFIQKNDYSYGIYLYGFPLSQALYAALPQLAGTKHLFKVSAILLTIAFASASWHLIERHALKLKPRVKLWLGETRSRVAAPL